MKKSEDKNYFTHDTELAIIAYNNSVDEVERNNIYDSKIHYAFFKLTQNIIHRFKFYYTEETNLEDLQHEVIIFLISKLHRFDASNGAKAYSYFGTVAKRYLIASNDKHYRRKLDLVLLEDLSIEQENGEYVQGDTLDVNGQTPETILTDATEDLTEFLEVYTEYCTRNINNIFHNTEDIKIADAVLNLFRKRDKLTEFNKKALYIYIREQVDAKTPDITRVANKLKELFKKHYSFYLEHGFINFK